MWLSSLNIFVFLNDSPTLSVPFVLWVLSLVTQKTGAGVAWCLLLLKRGRPLALCPSGRRCLLRPCRALSRRDCFATDTCKQMSVSRTCLPYPGLSLEIDSSVQAGFALQHVLMDCLPLPRACWQWQWRKRIHALKLYITARCCIFCGEKRWEGNTYSCLLLIV